MVALLHSSLLATLVFLDIFKQCSTRLLKVLHKCCNTDMHRIPPTHLPFPSCPQESYMRTGQTPHCCVQYINIYTCNQVLKEDD